MRHQDGWNVPGTASMFDPSCLSTAFTSPGPSQQTLPLLFVEPSLHKMISSLDKYYRDDENRSMLQFIVRGSETSQSNTVAMIDKYHVEVESYYTESETLASSKLYRQKSGASFKSRWLVHLVKLNILDHISSFNTSASPPVCELMMDISFSRPNKW